MFRNRASRPPGIPIYISTTVFLVRLISAERITLCILVHLPAGIDANGHRVGLLLKVGYNLFGSIHGEVDRIGAAGQIT